ncbi:MAG: leucyl aminopeptidase family protein [Leptospiraceae bacterium]|nr:leucyl aminopeptidase family protein [Leptospiraceae bacterium]
MKNEQMKLVQFKDIDWKFSLTNAHKGIPIVPIFKEDLQASKKKKRAAGLETLTKYQWQAVQRARAAGLFGANVNDVHYDISSGIVMIFLGSIEEFEPEKYSAQLIKTGARINEVSIQRFSFIITKSLEQALAAYLKKLRFLRKAKASFEISSANGFLTSAEQLQQERMTTSRMQDWLRVWISCLVSGGSSQDWLKNQSAEAGGHKKKRTVRKVHVVLSANKESDKRKKRLKAAIQEGQLAGEMINRARFLANLPANHMHPGLFERYVEESFEKVQQIKTRVFRQKELQKIGLNGIVSVGKGSSIEPRVIRIDYKPQNPVNKKPLVLIGKGVTFDTGGISLKPALQMHEMKFDMCGSALVTHALLLAAMQGLPLHVIGLLGLAENVPDAKAVKPGDVYTAYNGKTVEVQNTDAEGRLILGDLLAWASDILNPAALLEFSTLTGACVISLGHLAAGLMTPSEALYTSIEQASRSTQDRVWRLPHWQGYGTGLKSNIADFRNIGERAGGSLSAARFLAHFIGPDIPWAHFDIAGVAWNDGPNGAQVQGATGWGVRLLQGFMMQQCGLW